MFYDQGCFGRIELGDIPREVADRLSRVPGDWLEFDPPTSAIVVRHVEPTSSHHLPAIAFELVRLFTEIPAELHEEIPGGALFVHTEDEKGQLIRLRVMPGGAIHVRWAHPDFKTATRQAYQGGEEILIDPEVQRLDGSVTFRAQDAGEAARQLKELVDTFDGLYPEGDCTARVVEGMVVEISLREVNLDAAALIDLLQEVAVPGTLSGRFQVSSFGTLLPENQLRILFEAGGVLVQRPLLWPETRG